VNSNAESGTNVLTTKKTIKQKTRENYMIKILNEPKTMPPLTKRKRVVLASLIVAALGLPFLISGPRAHAQGEHREHFRDPLGSWIVQVALDPNTVPAGTPLSFMAIYTFSAGGGYTQSNTGAGAGGPPGQGNWVRTGEDKVASTQLRFGFDAANHFTGINKIRESFTFNEHGDELTGSSQVDIFLPDGTLLPIHPAATYHGTRVVIQPLN
jgi:hypothetical protein